MDQPDELRALIQTHYAALHRLALAMLDDSQAAAQVTLQVFAQAAQRPQPATGATQDWLYELVRKAIHRRYPASRTTPPGADPAAALFQWVARLDEQERLLLVLHYILKWPSARAAQLLHAGEGAVQAQMAIFRRELRRLLAAFGPPVASAGDAWVDQKAAELLGAHWPEVELSAEELEQLAGQALAQAAAPARPAARPGLRWLALGGLALAAVLVAGLAAVAFLLRSEPVAPSVTPIWGAEMPTPVTPAPRVRSLSARSSPQALQARLQESSSLWHTLWVDAQVYDYGPQSYIGQPRLYREQAWLSQPGQGMHFQGLLFRRPSNVWMVDDGRAYAMNPQLEQSTTGDWAGPTEALISDGVLRAMVFPGAAPWGSSGRLEAQGGDEIAGREVVVADWHHPQGGRAARLWLDAATGLVLRLQEFTGEGQVRRDAIVTGIAYDQNFPPGQFLSGLDLDEPPGATADPGGQVLPQRPVLELLVQARPRLPAEPPAPGFDPSRASLHFQFPGDLEASNSLSNTAPAQIYADGYLLGDGQFGLPWMLSCARSPDGLRLAFSTGTDGTLPPENQLRWFNLQEPERVYELLPGLRSSEFAFSPDGRRLAVFASSDEPGQTGVYIVEIGSGEKRLLAEMLGTSSLVWSPDGEFLALIGLRPEGEESEALVLHVRTGQEAFAASYDPVAGVEGWDWPVANWGRVFPVQMGGMDQCALPPVQNH